MNRAKACNRAVLIASDALPSVMPFPLLPHLEAP